MGLSVMSTEMDELDHLCPRDERQRDAVVADTYRAYRDIALEESNALAMSTWGLTEYQAPHLLPRRQGRASALCR
jgi:endo-1,4-beta-xylanase